MHRYSAKVRSIFSVLASILLLILLVLLAACSDISGKDSTSGSVSFSFDSNFLRSVNSRAAEYIGEWINKSEDGTEETKEYTVQFEVNILGDYTDSKTVEWKTQNYPDVHPAHQDIHNQETESEKIEYPEQKVTFDNIAVGKTVYAQVNVYVLYSDYTGKTQKELIMKGKSVTKTITEGENTLPVSVSSIYKMFPVSINLTFEKDTPSNAGDFGLISVYAFKKDSDILAKICKLCANEDDEAALEAIHYSSGSDGKVEPAFWYAADNVDVSENKAEYADGVFTLTGKMELVRDEELVFVALINYEGGTNGITYLGHVDANASNLEAVKSKAIVPNADGTNVELKLFRMDTVTSLYALYNKNSGIYQFYPTYESAISSAPYETPIESSTGSFAFDDAGNYYVLVYDGSSYSIKENYNDAISLPGEIPDLDGITIDRKENVLYGWFDNQGTFYIYKFPDFISEGKLESFEKINISFDSDLQGELYTYHDGTILVVNGGKLYGWGCEPQTSLNARKLYKADLTENSPTAHKIDFDYEALGFTGNECITDMFYQDGYVYILIRDYADNMSGRVPSPTVQLNYRSRGAIIRFDKSTNSFSAPLGYTSESIDNTNNYFYGHYNETKPYCLTNENYNDKSNWLKIAGDNSTVNSDMGISLTIAESLPKLYSPSNIDDKTAFFGPQKVIAIAPKKLVIADDGCAFYTDSNGAYNFKNANRVVEVDLESFSISSVKEVPVAFDKDLDSTITSSAFTNIRTLNMSNCIYLSNGSEYANTSTSEVQVGIPLGE